MRNEDLHPTKTQLSVPASQRAAPMSSLPQWVASLIASLSVESQPDRNGRWKETTVLPPNSVLTPDQRQMIANELEVTQRALDLDRPEDDHIAAQRLLAVLTKLMMSLPGASMQNELSVEARGEAFVDALSDIPVWIVEEAIKLWHRGEGGLNEQGKPYDYHWCPAPAELRRVANQVLTPLRARARNLDLLLRAAPRVEFSEEHRETMTQRIAGLLGKWIPPVGSDGSGGGAADAAAVVPTVGRGQAQPGLKREGGRRRRGDRRK